MGFASTPISDPGTQSDFHAWLPRMRVHAVVGRRHGQWYAIAPHFSVVGVGASEQQAREDLSGALETYLRTFHERGLSFERAVQPLSTLSMLRMFLPLRSRKRQVLYSALH